MSNVTLNQIKAIIFMVASVLVILSVLGIFLVRLEDFADRGTCRASVEAQAAGHIKHASLVADEVRCPTRYRMVEGRSADEVKRSIADEMRQCWDDFGRGRLELFDDEGVFCSVCAVMSFRRKDMVIDDFTEWLAETEIHDSQVTYLDYLAGFENMRAGDVIDDARKQVLQNNRRLSGTIQTDREYSVVLTYIKGKHWVAEYKKLIGSRLDASLIAGYGVGVGAGGLIASALVLVPGVNAGALTVVALSLGGGAAADIVTTWNAFFAKEQPSWIAFVSLKEHTADDFLDLGCEYYPSLQEKNKNNEDQI